MSLESTCFISNDTSEMLKLSPHGNETSVGPCFKAQRKEQEIAEEEEFRRRMLEKFAEDDRVEQMNAQRRRMKMAEHKREVERLAAVKHAMYAAGSSQTNHAAPCHPPHLPTQHHPPCSPTLVC